MSPEQRERAIAKRVALATPARVVKPEEMAAILGRDVTWVRQHRVMLPHLSISAHVFRILKEEISVWEEFSEIARRGEAPFNPNAGRQDTEGYVYFIQAAAGGPIKIGKANDVHERLATLQLYCPFELRVLAKRPGGYLLERELHHRFRAYRLHGEWFREDAPGLRGAMRPRKVTPA